MLISSLVKNLYSFLVWLSISCILGKGCFFRIRLAFRPLRSETQQNRLSFLGTMKVPVAHSEAPKCSSTSDSQSLFSSFLNISWWIKGDAYGLEWYGIASGLKSKWTWRCGQSPSIPLKSAECNSNSFLRSSCCSLVRCFCCLSPRRNLNLPLHILEVVFQQWRLPPIPHHLIEEYKRNSPDQTNGLNFSLELIWSFQVTVWLNPKSWWTSFIN